MPANQVHRAVDKYQKNLVDTFSTFSSTNGTIDCASGASLILTEKCLISSDQSWLVGRPGPRKPVIMTH